MARTNGYRQSAVWRPCGVTQHAALQNKSVVCSGSRVTNSTVMKLHGSDNRGGNAVKTYTKSTCSHLHLISFRFWRQPVIKIIALACLCWFGAYIYILSRDDLCFPKWNITSKVNAISHSWSESLKKVARGKSRHTSYPLGNIKVNRSFRVPTKP